MELWKMSYKQQQKEIKKRIWPVTSTETLLRQWERRLIVALTDAEKQKCKYYINLYKTV